MTLSPVVPRRPSDIRSLDAAYLGAVLRAMCADDDGDGHDIDAAGRNPNDPMPSRSTWTRTG